MTNVKAVVKLQSRFCVFCVPETQSREISSLRLRDAKSRIFEFATDRRKVDKNRVCDRRTQTIYILYIGFAPLTKGKGVWGGLSGAHPHPHLPCQTPNKKGEE